MKRASTFHRLFETPILLILIAVLVAVVAMFTDPATSGVAIQTLIAVAFVSGLSLFAGNAGIMSFGHVSFMAVGAYVTAYLTIPVSLKSSIFAGLPSGFEFLATIHAGFSVAVIGGGLAAMVLALAVAPAVVRLGGLQAGIATLALLVIVFTVVNSWTDVTRGSSSMIGLPRSTTAWWALGGAALAIVIAWAYKKSRSGLQLQASREDHLAATAVGIAVGRHRAFAWVLSAFPAGMAGALYAGFMTTFNSNNFFLSLTFSFIVMVVLGGYLSLSGSVIGAVGVSVLQELLRRFQDGSFTGGVSLPGGIADLILAAILLFVLVKAPLGLMGTRELHIRRRRSVGTDS